MKRLSLYIVCVLLTFSITGRAAAKTEYIVQKGDTFWEIALSNKVELDILIQMNSQVSNPDIIFPGQKIFIPGGKRIVNIVPLSPLEKTLFDLTNAKRKQIGLRPLLLDQTLLSAARQKSLDMMKNEYVSHISPRYGDYKTMLKALQIPFENVRECIGAGTNSAEEILQTWLSSSVNKANILDKESNQIGIGYAKGGLHGHYWTVYINQKAKGGN
ncbi:LysM peptidoglycan-binding domain-containing protein [Cytobacillus depressus]|uniref:LysM peptidoglycan-binding domain-containing protein n=1 Tax=Cytobacillus depressus TaxID=1602942 RepID=A0A6L3V7G9_9BACI|nr:CAP domain-containing protein [Cytobacillus depressus]KAB2337384.1 LysM peptidoglycan-binding domain-containing protein [Cytobacillus depressus]